MSNADEADVGSTAKSGEPRLSRYRLIAHVIAWGLCLGLFVFVVPRIEAIFKDFNVPLPRNTAFVISASHQVIRYQGLILVGLILVISGTEWFARVAYSDQTSSDSSRRLSRLMLISPLALMVLAVMALSIPLFTIMTHLSG